MTDAVDGRRHLRPARALREPALDGLRGIAVAAVFLFHCGVPWMRGGFLGVSSFFTLSGFLITGLVLREADRSGRVDLVRFWERRVRRLVPAGVLAVALVVALAPWLAEPEQRRGLPAEATASLLYVANWYFGWAGTSYAALFERPSLLLHFWSLGVEGQFYLAVPPLMALAARAAGWAGIGLLVSSLGLASVLGTTALAGRAGAFDRVYYGTDTRALELLMGALAALLAARLVPRDGGRARAGIAVAGMLALLLQLVAWTTTGMGAPWVTRGGLGTYAFLTAVVVLAAVEPRGPVRAALAAAPLRRLGEISYGVYLFHWPIVLWLTPERLGWAPWAVDAARASATLLVAEASYRWLELPVRTGRMLPERRVFGAAAVATAALAVAARLVPAPPRDALFAEIEAAAGTLNAPARAEPEAGRAVRYAVFGDSTAAPTARAFETWVASASGGEAFVRTAGRVRLGCGIMGPAERRDVTVPAGHECPDVVREWAERVRRGRVQLAIVQTGAWESREHAIARGGPVVRPGDREFDEHLRRQMTRVVDALSAAGAVVVWIEAPHVGPGKRLGSGGYRLSDDLRDPARIDRHNAILREVASTRHGRVALVDLAALLGREPGGELDAAARPDGMHLTTTAADRLAPTLGPVIAAAFAALR